MTKRSDEPGQVENEEAGAQRLQKVLAAAGVGSRRDCEELIRDGRVEVDRQVVTELGTRVDPTRQEIRVDGEALRQPKRLYFAVNKPIGVVSTSRDPSGRSRVIDLVPTEERVFAVGRLDRSSEGLILVTNDGEFANRLTHPRYGVEKTYWVRVAGKPEPRQLARLKKGVHLAEGYARAASIAVKKQHGHSTDMIIVLNEGRNREIRRILARVGHKVLGLKRIAVGPLKLGDLPVGGWRRLGREEIESLLAVAKEKRRAAKKRPQPTLGRSASKGDAGRDSPDDNYLQKKALLAEPLSLDDLLRDDMDEGPIGPTVGEVAGEQPIGGEERSGAVIHYEGESSSASPKAGKYGNGNRRHRTRRPQNSRQEAAGLPRESFGKKRSGKRVFGPQEGGRGPAGEKGGNLRFRPKRKKRFEQAQGNDNQRRGKRRHDKSQQQFGKQGGKRKGRR